MSKFVIDGDVVSGSTSYASAISCKDADGNDSTVQAELDKVSEQNKNFAENVNLKFTKVTVKIESIGDTNYAPYPDGYSYDNTTIVSGMILSDGEKIFFPGTTSSAYLVTGLWADSNGICAYSKYDSYAGRDVEVIICKTV